MPDTSETVKLLVGADLPMVTAALDYFGKIRETMSQPNRDRWDDILLDIVEDALDKTSIRKKPPVPTP